MFEQTPFEATGTQTHFSTATLTTTSEATVNPASEGATVITKAETLLGEPATVPVYPYDAPLFVDDEETESDESLLLPNGRPKPEAVRGRCPECGDDLVSNLYYIGGEGYLMVWECWGSLGENAQCSYRHVL